MKLKIDKGIKFRGSSLFVKMSRDELEYLDVIKSFNSYYHKSKNMWELPKVAFKTILDKCSNCASSSDQSHHGKPRLRMEFSHRSRS